MSVPIFQHHTRLHSLSCPIGSLYQLTRTEHALCPQPAKPAYSWIVAANAMFRCHLSRFSPSPPSNPPRAIFPVISPLLSLLGWLTRCSSHYFAAPLLLRSSTSTILIPLTHTPCVSLYQQLLEITSCLPPCRCVLQSLWPWLAGACEGLSQTLLGVIATVAS